MCQSHERNVSNVLYNSTRSTIYYKCSIWYSMYNQLIYLLELICDTSFYMEYLKHNVYQRNSNIILDLNKAEQSNLDQSL